MNKKLIDLGSNGEISNEVYGYDSSTFSPFSSYVGTPLIVDSDIKGIGTVRTILLPDGSTANQSVSINPCTEQILNGTIAGAFNMNEQVSQSQYIPTLINGLALSGYTAAQYLPTVATIGLSGAELGNRSIQFKGSYLDTNTKAAGLQLPAFTTTTVPYYMMSGFLYLETEPSTAYDPILITRSANGATDTTNDSFRLEYDTSSKQLQFHFATSNWASAGYQAILNVCPANGVTLNQWHQFAIAYSNVGSSATVSSYWNGARYAQTTGITGYLKNSTGSFMLGSGASGDKPLKGYLEHLIVSMGTTTAALREFPHSATGPVSTNQFAGDYTVYAMTMNGPLGSSLFPCASTKRVISTASFTDPLSSRLGVANVSRENTSVHGVTMFAGVDGGHTASSVAAAAGYLFGYDSGACMVIAGVTSTISLLSDSQKIKGNLVDHTIAYLVGSTAMRGLRVSPGDFPTLFAGSSASFSGDTFSFLPTTSNVSILRSIYDNIIIAGVTAPYNLSDFEGNMYTFSTGGVKNLYADVVSYQSTAFNIGSSLKVAINAASTKSNLYELNGFSGEGLVNKLAPQLTTNGFLYLSGKGKATKKTNNPEKQNIVSVIEIAELEPKI
tara:strand:- start:45687 stop:47525 length:1839 start_codon:yes stop_codon:yes gene_type:complete